jgi:sugar phosphate isomerase/epimerase
VIVRDISRRIFLASTAAESLAMAAKQSGHTIGFGYGTYGMQSMKTADALRTIAEIGYDGVELCLIPGWPTESKALSAGDRADIRKMLGDLGLALPAMLESLPLIGTPEKRSENLERVKRAAALAHDLSPANPPVLDTVLGLKTADWEKVKARMVVELHDWAKAAESSKFVICFKPHASDAVNSPERALWLIREVGSPNIRVVYDYSHFFVEGFPLAESLKQLLPVSPFISVKDASGNPASHQFLLPGDGKTDYMEYFKLLKELGYHGFVAVEISAMIHRKPGFEPVPTAKLCYQRLAPVFVQAGLRRPARKG